MILASLNSFGLPLQGLGTRFGMSTTDHSQTDGQTEQFYRVVGDVLRIFRDKSPKTWSSMLPVIEFGLNNAFHASTSFNPLYVNSLTHLRVPLTLPQRVSVLGGRGSDEKLADISPTTI